MSLFDLEQNKSRVCELLRVDDVWALQNTSGDILVTLRIGDKYAQVTIEKQDLMASLSQAETIGKILMNAATQMRGAIEQVLRASTFDLATSADLDRIAGITGVPSETFRAGYDVEPEETRHATRFHAIVDELEKELKRS